MAEWPPQKGQGPEVVTGLGDALAAQGVDSHGLARLMLGFLHRSNRPARRRIYEGVAGGQTDSDGNLALVVFTVPQGCLGHLTRLVVEGAGYTAGAPYSSGASWIGVFEVESAPATAALGAEATLGMLRAFGPAAAGGGWLPAIFTDNDSNAWAYRAGMSVVLNLQGGPASKQITASYRINLESNES
jgi:hypothetical protein